MIGSPERPPSHANRFDALKSQTLLLASRLRNKAAVQTVASVMLLTVAWIAMVAILRPVGEFPLMDDWMYTRTVFLLVTKGQYWLCDFQAVTAFAQVLWGALFSLIFGFSMTTLRISVVVLGWGGIVAAFFLFREAGARRRLSLLGAALLAATPFYFVQANSFMTDVPFTALSTAAAIFLIRWIKNEKGWDLLLGLFFACAAVLVRQLALFMPLSFALAYGVKRGFRLKAVLIGALSVGVVAGTLFIYDQCLKMTIGIPAMAAAKAHMADPVIGMLKKGQISYVASFLSFTLAAVFVYLGVLLSPVLLILAPLNWQRYSLRRKISSGVICSVFILGVVIMMTSSKLIMPLIAGLIYKYGIGFNVISGSKYLRPLPGFFWQVITAVGVIGGGVLAAQIVDVAGGIFRDLLRRKNTAGHWPSILCLSAFFILFVPLAISGHFDRYLITYMPFLIYFLIENSPGRDHPRAFILFPVAVIMIFAMAYFSVAGTHDYFSWQRARWDALSFLMKEKKVPPSEIDGGYEFNGWFLYRPEYRKVPGRNWWWVEDDKYLVSFGPKEGYRGLFEVPYDCWLPPRKGKIFVLIRIKENVARDYSKASSVYLVDEPVAGK